jgi:hypothetical protein
MTKIKPNDPTVKVPVRVEYPARVVANVEGQGGKRLVTFRLSDGEEITQEVDRKSLPEVGQLGAKARVSFTSEPTGEVDDEGNAKRRVIVGSIRGVRTRNPRNLRGKP